MTTKELNWDKPSLAVVACDGDGHGCVLHTVGPHVAFDMREIGRDLDDLGLDDAPAGISIWEGVTAGGGYAGDGDYHDTYLSGAFRAPTDDEWKAIREGRCPWNPDDWAVPSKTTEVTVDEIDDDPYEGSFREAADNEGARIAAESREDGDE